MLSNGDLESLDRAVNGLSIPVDRAISAEGAGYYKPHTGVYQHAMKELGLMGEQVLHVAAHAWDIRGARAAAWPEPTSTVMVYPTLTSTARNRTCKCWDWRN